MIHWSAPQVAGAAGGTLAGAPAGGEGTSDTPSGPGQVSIDSRQARPGTLFIGLPGANYDGGQFAAAALAAGAWGAIVTPPNVEAARAAGSGIVITAADPLRALQSLATAWRRELGADVIGVTGSTGKTTTKDLLYALLSPHQRTSASRANYNTEIGLPLEILAAPAGTEVLVLEMAMRGVGQIAELAAIAEPDVGVIVSIGPVHLELLGTIENVAAAKAELIAGLAPGATAVLPAGEHLLTPHRREDVRTVTFGPGGDVDFVAQGERRVRIVAAETQIELEVPFQQAHLRLDLLAAVAAAEAVGVTPTGRVDLALTAGRGENLMVAGGIKVIDGCYNANPMSMRAALADLADTAGREGAARRVAVLGDMLELGPGALAYHEALGELVEQAGVDLLVTVGPLAAAISERFSGESQPLANAQEAAAIVPELLQSGDLVLIKGSLGVGLKQVCDALGAGAQA
ncbi:MAG: UDP-N-acetylmuramoyl-tripeptide--D-alanyl-D-alanine ligase [Solirubrobacteraceae bacterium]|jgi:UDP-N-acetylmuramoyl-tripeptide--D-alanyl-D-alanine ligase|nr:UDP-N-acetylmuramoyl-tripeptide--D-alanyl-D-alanine ligase [Solirubrobacteraceae bacterium]